MLSIVISALLAGCSGQHDALPVDTVIHYDGIHAVNYRLRNFANGPDGQVYGSRGAELHRIAGNGEQIELIHRFSEKINGIHVTATGAIVVSTDEDHWNPQEACRIYRSADHGQNFELIRTFFGGSALWWSLASDRAGNIYVGEYGPQQADMSKTVWRLAPAGDDWTVVFRAPNRERVHIHRVAVDPYSDALWVTVGDGDKNHGIYRSRDQGNSWEKVLESQATGVAFTPTAIYWGEDLQDEGRVTRFDRQDARTETVLNASSRGNFGGSIYSLAAGEAGYIYAPMMKYPDQSHAASLWAGKGKEWKLLLQLASTREEGVAVQSIGGPDKDGWLYISGYKIKDLK